MTSFSLEILQPPTLYTRFGQCPKLGKRASGSCSGFMWDWEVISFFATYSGDKCRQSLRFFLLRACNLRTRSIKLKGLEFEASLCYRARPCFKHRAPKAPYSWCLNRYKGASKLDLSSTYRGRLPTSLVLPFDNHRLGPNSTSQHAFTALQSNFTGFKVARAAHWDL